MPAVMRQRLSVFTSIAVLVAGLTLAAQPRDALSVTEPPAARASGVVAPPRSPRNANYSIDVRLDPATRALTASEHIVWRNITANSTSELQFHVYWNAWRDTKSTFIRERALVAPDTHSHDDFARLEITALTYHPDSSSAARSALPARGAGASGVESDRGAGVSGEEINLTSAMRFIAPDDGNPDDRTVLAVTLPGPVKPGETIAIDLKWTARVPRPFARTGAIGNFYFLAQWFPKLGVLQDDGWNCHQFHAATEFFSDYGVYDVGLTVPTGWVVGATGAQRSRVRNADGTETHRYYQEDVHDFAWTTSPEFIERIDRFESTGTSVSAFSAQPPVELRLLILPEHARQAGRHFDAAKRALKYYSEWFGPYPYNHLTVVDPAFHSEADGMEYPTLITGGTSFLIPSQITINTPEEVVIHEAGHQFFYGIVGTNEFEDAWMDEGINTFASARAMLQDGAISVYEYRFFGGFVPWVSADLKLDRETVWNRLPGYRRAPKSDRPSDPSFRYYPPTGRTVSYNKTALWLNTLERHLGWEALRRVLSTYFLRWQFKHPKPDDFFRLANEVTGQDLGWFFDQVYRSSNVFDYAVDLLKSTKDDARFRTELIVRREGEALFPVDVRVSFEDGEQITEKWDGRDRWKRYAYEGKARARSAQIDPDRVLLLDVNYTNNSKTLAPQAGRAATKWSLKWLVWLQDALLTWAFFA
jgi:hypothetical protein